MSLAVVITRNYVAAQASLRTRFGLVAAKAWTNLPHYDEADLVELAVNLEVPTAVMRASAATLTAGYLSHFTGATTPVTLSQLGEFDAAEAWRPAFMSTWGALTDGAAYEDAVAVGGERVSSVAGQIVTEAARGASVIIDKKSPGLVYWNRVPGGNCCRWCADVAGNTYGSADAASLNNQHANCNCSLVPITRDAAPGREINAALNESTPDSAYVTADGAPAERP